MNPPARVLRTARREGLETPKDAVGISSANHLKNIFLRHVGTTMRAYRKTDPFTSRGL